MDRLGIPSGSRNSVKKVLSDILEGEKRNDKYNAKSGVLRRGRKKLITEGSEEVAIILRCAAADLSSLQIAVAVNHHRASKNPAQAAISWNTVASYLTNSDLIVRQLRRNRTTGCFNPEKSGWAQARKAQCEQFLFQLSLGEFPPDELQRRDIVMLPDGDSLPPPLRLYGIVSWDEHHKECVLDGLGKFETRVYQTDQGVPTHPRDGGMLPQRRLTVTTKFALEARELFGVAGRKNSDGS